VLPVGPLAVPDYQIGLGVRFAACLAGNVVASGSRQAAGPAPAS